MKKLTMAIFMAAAGTVPASVETVCPGQGETVALVPEVQKKVMSLPTLAERLKAFKGDRALRHDKSWRKSVSLVLKWKATEGEGAPWKIEIGKSPDLSDARTWFAGDKDCKAEGSEWSYTVPMANLEIAREYHWRDTGRAGCGKPGCDHKSGCPARKKRVASVASVVATFCTEDLAPRWIVVDGSVGNIRDLGGRRTADGRRVKQGMAYRGQGLNNNSATGEKPGRNRLMVEDVKYLTGTLGIRTDLDLRSARETADMKTSPLGTDVAFIHNSSPSYKDIFTSGGKMTMAKNFRVFCNPTNYPIYFHCIGGAVRTGSLAYVLNGVLGVDRHDLETDWESTFYPNIPDANPDPGFWRRESHFNDGFSKYGKEGDSWNRRIELYLLDCGVTEGEIKAFRAIMLEPKRKGT